MKAKTYMPVISQSSQTILKEYGSVLSHVDLINSVFIWSFLKHIQEKTDFVNKNVNLTWLLTFTDWFVSNLVWRWTPLNSTFWCQFEWPWPTFKVTVVWEKKVCSFSWICYSVWMKLLISLLLSIWSLVCTINIKRGGRGGSLCTWFWKKKIFLIFLLVLNLGCI